MVLRLTPEETTRPLMTLPDPSDPKHSEDFSAAQATKLHLTLGEKSPGFDTIANSMSERNSEVYKRMLADDDLIRQTNAQNDVLDSILKTDPSMVTSEVVDVARGLSSIELRDPDLSSIIERKYAQLFTETSASALDNDILAEAIEADAEGAHQVLDRAEVIAFKKNYAASKLDELSTEFSEQSMLAKAWDFTERVIPFLEWHQKHNAIEGAEGFTTSILPGNNLEEQFAFMWGLDSAEEFQTTLDQVVEDLRDRNLQVAQSWVEGLFSYGSADAFMDNAFAVVDAAATIPLKTLATAMKSATKASMLTPAKMGQIAASLGKNGDAAVLRNVEDLASDSFLGGTMRRSKDLENVVPSITSPEKLLTGADNIPQAAYLRMKEALLARSELARRFLFEPNLVDRLTPDELIRYKDILLDDYVRANPSVQKNVIDVRISDKADVGNVYEAEVVLGMRDGTLFQSEGQARLYFSRWIKGTDDYRIEQVGGGFQIVIPKTVDETKFLSDLQVSTDGKTPEGVLANVGWWRSPNYTLSRQEELQRSTVVSSSELLATILDEIATPLQKLPKKQMDEIRGLMASNTKDQKYYENYGEFAQAFFDRYKKSPTIEQADAYFANVQINDLDLVVRNLDWYKQKARQGREEISLRIGDEDVVFEGKRLDDLPYGSQTPFRVTIEKDGVLGKPKSSRYLNESDKAEIQKLKDAGYKIFQVASNDLKVGDRSAGFVITNRAKTSRIGVMNVDRKPGGHQVHKYPYYIKQGRISTGDGESFYRGDTTLFNVANAREGEELLKVLEEARRLTLARDKGALKFVRDNLPITTREWMAAIKRGDIDLNVRFVQTKKGLRTTDTGAYSDLPNFRDVTRSEHNLDAQLTGRYGGERSETAIDIIRSEGDTKFEIAEAPFLDPMDTLRSASNNLLSVRAMNDYTISTNQNFLRQFGDILEGTREEQLSNGTALLTNPIFKEGAVTLQPERVAAAKNVSRAFNNLSNHGTALDRKIEFYKEKLLSSVMPVFGARGRNWLEGRMLNRSTDPGVFLRGIAFDFKLGLFNPQHLFIQANSLVNIVSIAGRHGLRGGLAYPLFRGGLLTTDPAKLKALAKVAETAGLMKADEFVESMALYKKSGFNNIGGDVAFLDDVASPELRKGNVRKGVNSFLEWGRTPFKEGERMVRTAAWNAAYLEKRAVKATGELTRRDQAEILQRAKDLTGNQTRESNAAWQKGYAAVFTQFFGYQARIMEQMIGKKLTPAEKIRLFTGYSAMYGVPVAMGSVAGVIPVRDIVMDTLLGMGVDPDDTAIEPFVDGFASSFFEYVFGTELNIADRYGPGGLPTFYDFFRGDKDWYDMFLGASGSIAIQTVSDAIPVLKGMASEFSDFEGGYHNLTADDFLEPLRNISSVDNAMKLYHVMNFGVWASRNEAQITEMDLPEAVVAALTGLQPGRIEDGFRKLGATQDFKKAQEAAAKELTKRYRRAMRMEDGPTRDKVIHGIKAQMVLEGFTMPQMAQIYKRASSTEMMTDIFFENYEKLQQRKERMP